MLVQTDKTTIKTARTPSVDVSYFVLMLLLVFLILFSLSGEAEAELLGCPGDQ